MDQINSKQYKLLKMDHYLITNNRLKVQINSHFKIRIYKIIKTQSIMDPYLMIQTYNLLLLLQKIIIIKRMTKKSKTKIRLKEKGKITPIKKMKMKKIIQIKLEKKG